MDLRTFSNCCSINPNCRRKNLNFNDKIQKEILIDRPMLLQNQIIPFTTESTSDFIPPDDWIIEKKQRCNGVFAGRIDKVFFFFPNFGYASFVFCYIGFIMFCSCWMQLHLLSVVKFCAIAYNPWPMYWCSMYMHRYGERMLTIQCFVLFFQFLSI